MKTIRNNNKAKYIILAIILISLITSIIIPILNNKDVLYATEAEIEGIKYSYNTTKKELMITAKTANSQVKSTWQTNSELSKYVNSIENIVINGIEEISIEENAFKDCISLKNITLTEKCTVSETAFEGCIALETLTVIKENNEKLQYTYTDGAWVEKNKTTQTVSTEEIEETSEEVEQEIETVEQNVKLASVSQTLNSGTRTWQVTESGVYKVELWGAQGADAKECEGGTRKVIGQKGAKVTGYIELSKGDNIEIKFYAGGAQSATYSIGDYSTYGGAGGSGIGIYLNDSATPFGAAGGGPGGTSVALHENDGVYHGGQPEGILDGKLMGNQQYNSSFPSKDTEGNLLGTKGEPGGSQCIKFTVVEMGTTVFHFMPGGGGGGYPHGRRYLQGYWKSGVLLLF